MQRMHTLLSSPDLMGSNLLHLIHTAKNAHTLFFLQL